MIVCPKCKTGLKRQENSLKCNKCKFTAKVKSGIVYFHPGIPEDLKNYNAKFYEELYRHEQKHFWFTSRKNVILRHFKDFVKPEESILEIGAGTGDIMRELISKGYKNVAVGEIHASGLKYAKNYGIKQLFQFDVNKSPFKNHFDVIGAFDVFEHLDNDDLALKNIKQMLKRYGRVIITVPAHNWLWSDIDRQSGHLRRYNSKTLQELLERNSFEILAARGFFASMLPLLYVRTLLNKKKSNKKLEDRNGFKINPQINWMFKTIMLIENSLIMNIPASFGGSIIIIARKK